MVKRLFFLIFGLLVLLHGHSQTLSRNAKISLLTCDSGDELYSIFGHSAIRVCDTINHIDWVYNYGTFDFGTPNFYWKFAQGDLNYQLSVYKFKYFLPEYFSEGRSVIEQEFNLTIEDKQTLFERLNTNALPENKNYRYDFFFDNCATRIRDQIIALDQNGKVQFSTVSQGKTYRGLYGEYLKQSPWIEFGIHLLLGMKADRPASSFDEMYLPEFLYVQFKQAKISMSGGEVNLIAKEIKLLDFPKTDKSKSFIFWPCSVFSVLLILVTAISFYDLKRAKNSTIVDTLLFIPAGMAGLLFVFLWFFTKHGVTGDNLNLLWANPFYFIVVSMLLFKTTISKVLEYLVLIFIALNVFFILFYVMGLQQFPASLILVVVALTVRLTVIFYNSLRHRRLDKQIEKV
ncbi:MAG: DUF4105 domain-containing protein [Breznakibacter sp.]